MRTWYDLFTARFRVLVSIFSLKLSLFDVFEIIRADVLQVAQCFSEPHRGEEKCEQ